MEPFSFDDLVTKRYPFKGWSLITHNTHTTYPSFQALNQLGIVKTRSAYPLLTNFSSIAGNQVIRKLWPIPTKIYKVIAHQHSIYTCISLHMVWIDLAITF